MLAAAFLSAVSAVLAGERRIELKDFTGRGFAPDVVSYSVTIPKGGASAFRLTGPEGQSLPVQVAPAPSNGATTLSFVANSRRRVKHIWADGGYAGSLVTWVRQMWRCTVEIVKRTEAHTFRVLPGRWGVERTFGWLGPATAGSTGITSGKRRLAN